MVEVLRVLLLLALAAAALTTAALGFSWWMEPTRRLDRAMKRVLAGSAEVIAVSSHEGKAVGLDFDSGQLAVLWDRGANGLVYAFDEVQGAELIVDGHVLARIRRREPRRDLDVLAPDANTVVLRLLFADTRQPEFELTLWNAVQPTETGSPSEALRQGRRWLSHIEAMVRG